MTTHVSSLQRQRVINSSASYACQNPRRLMLRACIQSALDLLRSDVEAFTSHLAEVLDVDLDAHAPVVPEQDHSVTGLSEDRSVVESWASVSDAVTDLAERVTDLAERAAADLAGDQLPAGPETLDGQPSAPGRGSVLLTWVGKEGAAGVVRTAAAAAAVGAGSWLAANVPTGVAKLIEALLNLVGL